MARSCIRWGGRAEPGSARCYNCGGRRRAPGNTAHRSRAYTELAKRVRATAETCWLCGGGPRPDNPWQADHVVPVTLGGTNTVDNLRAAHASCNARRGGQLGAQRGRTSKLQGRPESGARAGS